MRYFSALGSFLLLSAAAHADLTVHYNTSYKFAQGLPPALTDAMQKQMGTAVPTSNEVKIHGNKVASKFGELVSVVDYDLGQITFIHPESKRYATASAEEFKKAISSMIPAAAQAAAQGMQTDVQVKRTGRTASVNGISAEEAVVTMEMQGGPGLQMKMELHNWMATAEAMSKFPAFKEWNARKWMESGMNPADMMSAISQGASAEKLRASMTQLVKESAGLTLKTETQVFMPMMAQMMKGQGVELGDGPLVSTVMEMDRYSADPIPASTFEVPAGYQAAPLADLLRDASPLKAMTMGAPGK